MAFCEKCGDEINKSWKHCPACGQPVKKIIANKLISKEASPPPAKKSRYKKEIAIVLVAVFILSLGLFTFSRSSSDSSNYVDPTKARLYEGPELPELIGVDKFAMVDKDASWTRERFVEPVDDFVSSRYCDIDNFLNRFTTINFAGTYRIEGSPDFMIQSPESYEFATLFEKAMHLVLAYAVPLRELEEYVYYDKKQKRLYSKQFESYKSDVSLAAKSLCIPFTQVRYSTQAESVIKKFTDEKYRKTFLDFTENKVASTYVYKYEDDGKVFCKEEETNLNGTKLITCYP